jgi:hypothetical protein
MPRQLNGGLWWEADWQLSGVKPGITDVEATSGDGRNPPYWLPFREPISDPESAILFLRRQMGPLAEFTLVALSAAVRRTLAVYNSTVISAACLPPRARSEHCFGT